MILVNKQLKQWIKTVAKLSDATSKTRRRPRKARLVERKVFIMPILGCHLSDHNGFVSMGTEAVGLNTQTFQFFTRNPRGGKAKTWDSGDEKAYIEYAEENHLSPFVAYAPYTINPASGDQQEADFARLVMSEDLARLDVFPASFYALRPGSVATDENHQQGIYRVINALNEVIEPTHKSQVLIITTAGSGHEIGSTLSEMKAMLEGIKPEYHVGACLDTTAMWNAGYDLKNNLDKVIEEVDKTIGLDNVKAVHLADPKYGLGSHHTNHMDLGQGELGLEGLSAVFHHPALADKTFILETPHDAMDVYAKAIAALEK